jgi:hypothetical protein
MRKEMNLSEHLPSEHSVKEELSLPQIDDAEEPVRLPSRLTDDSYSKYHF